MHSLSNFYNSGAPLVIAIVLLAFMLVSGTVSKKKGRR